VPEPRLPERGGSSPKWGAHDATSAPAGVAQRPSPPWRSTSQRHGHTLQGESKPLRRSTLWASSP